METAWFCLLAVMVTMYVVLDGFDLGVGALHLFLSRNEEEREEATAAIGPVWNGNEVWLLASGGVLFMAFPKAYAGAFSGLYFGLIIVLWLLVGRGLGLEFRHQLESPLWRGACDAVFCLSSAALALVFGVALGNVVRGVPLGADGYFSLPLFSILNWYALLIGVFGLVVLAAHGAAFLAFRGTGDLAMRARRWARGLWIAEALLFVALIGPTYAVRDEMLNNLVDHPVATCVPAVGRGRPRRHVRPPARGRLGTRLHGLIALHRRAAHHHGRGPVPESAARARGRPPQPDGRQRGGRVPHAEGGARLVADRHGARGRLLRLRVQDVLPPAGG